MLENKDINEMFKKLNNNISVKKREKDINKSFSNNERSADILKKSSVTYQQGSVN